MLPEDILIHIIEHLPNDRNTLSKFFTTARVFTRPSQRRIYRTCVLQLEKRSHMERLTRRLIESPHLVLYIETLVLSMDPFLYVGTEVPPVGRPLALVLSLLLDRLTALRSLSIDSGPYSDEPSLEWTYLPPELQDSFLRLFRLPSLVSIHIDGGILPVSVFARSSQLKMLRLSNSSSNTRLESVLGVDPPVAAVFGLPPSDGSRDRDQVNVRLETYTIEALALEDRHVEHLATVIDFSQLRALIWVDATEGCIRIAEKMVRLCSRTLERIRWVAPLSFTPYDGM
ncbi:hypothetical protein DXG03_003328 [Asterophora parasitica]|uniref:F-box domain-containing protein n=1 Tax=Asterophora parasitica TaxID=117018 RepID=A0A9P7G3R6_9AGAR|nr:hypothetical protein DXG03_003328 [Asterophora parasitica]